MVRLIKEREEYSINVVSSDKNAKNKLDLLCELENLEREGLVKIHRSICGIDNIRVSLYANNVSDGKYDLIKRIKDLSGLYGNNISVCINNSLLKDVTAYKFASGKMMEKEYHLA